MSSVKRQCVRRGVRGRGGSRLVALGLMFGLLSGAAAAQPVTDVGSPDAAFAGGPIRLSAQATAVLRAQFHGDNVPLIPQPFRGRLDTALAGNDWRGLAARKQELVVARGLLPVLQWEQTRFLATSGAGIAALYALDIAASGNHPTIHQSAATLWLYAMAVAMTDGHKCLDPASKDAFQARLMGPEFAPVAAIIRTMAADALTAAREAAIRMEATLSPGRTDESMCRAGSAMPKLRADPDWQPETAQTRQMLPRHLGALCTVMRSKQAR